MSKKIYARLLAALYVLALAAWLAARLAGWATLAKCETRPLAAADAQLEAIFTHRTWATYGEGSLLTTDDDARLVWTLDAPVSGLQMTIRSSRPVLNPELYYITAPGQEFTAGQRLRPVDYDEAAGVYTFRLDTPLLIHQLRLDPTGSGGAFMQLDVLLNPPISAARWFVPGAAALLALAAAPPLLATAIAVAWQLPALRRRAAPGAQSGATPAAPGSNNDPPAAAGERRP